MARDGDTEASGTETDSEPPYQNACPMLHGGLPPHWLFDCMVYSTAVFMLVSALGLCVLLVHVAEDIRQLHGVASYARANCFATAKFQAR